MTRQIGVGGSPSRSWSGPLGVIVRGRNLQDAGHRANGMHGLVRAHEPVTRWGSTCSPVRTRLPPLPGSHAPDGGDGSHAEGGPVPPAQRLSARQRPAASCAVGSNSRALRACVRIAPDRPSVAGTPADKRFGSGASDTSKINFKGSTKPGQLQLQLPPTQRCSSSSPNTNSRGATFRSRAITCIACRGTRLLLHKGSLPGRDIERGGGVVSENDCAVRECQAIRQRRRLGEAMMSERFNGPHSTGDQKQTYGSGALQEHSCRTRRQARGA